MGSWALRYGDRGVELEDVHQLVHHLRLRYVEDLHHGSEVGKLLHGVLLDPLLRLWRFTQTGWPPPAGLFVVQAEELRLEREGEEAVSGGPLELRRVLQLVPLSRPRPSSGAVHCGA